MTSRPCALSSRARLVTAMVGDGLMRPSADERIGKGGAPGVEAGAVLGRRVAGGNRRRQRPQGDRMNGRSRGVAGQGLEGGGGSAGAPAAGFLGGGGGPPAP